VEYVNPLFCQTENSIFVWQLKNHHFSNPGTKKEGFASLLACNQAGIPQCGLTHFLQKINARSADTSGVSHNVVQYALMWSNAM
jgi:hypothetical protein